MVKPNERSSHFKNIPQLGGLAITIPILIITFLLGSIVLSIGEFTLPNGFNHMPTDSNGGWRQGRCDELTPMG